MSSRTVSVSLNANVSGFIGAMGRAASSVDQVGSKMVATATKNRAEWDRVGSTLIGVGAAAIAGVGVVTKTFADFDKAMSGVAATGQDARNNLDGLRETAIKVGADTSFSAREAAAGMEELLKAGVSAADVMGGGLAGSMDLAAAGTLAVADASEIAATAMTQFGLSGKDVPHIADLLAAGAGKAQGSVHDLGLGLKQSGLVASQFGLSIEETTGTLSAFASMGLIGSDAGTSFKAMLIALANPSKQSAKLMKDLGIAAYDANGKFVGMEKLAGQLKERLSGLTQSQRDQALAQIFGNDAIRAANVLYQQGSDGIAQWTRDVNEAGYAAKTAAELQNNLAGDLEKLGGSIESLFLKAGSGGNDFLRGLTQGAESAVDAFGKLPPSAQQGALAFAAIAGAGALAVGGLMKGVTAVGDTVAAWSTLKSESPRVAGALSAVGKAAGLVAGAFVALQATAAVMRQFEEPAAVQGIEAMTNALTGLANGTPRAQENLDKFFQTASGGAIAEGNAFRNGIDDMGSALDRFFNKSSYEKYADSVDGIFGMASAADKAGAAFAEMDAAFARMEPGKAAAAFREVRAQAEDQGISMEKLLTIFPKYRAQLIEVATAMGETNLSAQDYADWMGGRVPDAIMRAASTNESYAAALAQVMGATQVTAGSTRELTSALQAMPPETKVMVTMPNGEMVLDTAENIQRRLQGLPPRTETAVSAPGAPEATAQLGALARSLTEVPSDKPLTITGYGIPETEAQVGDLAAVIREVPDSKPVTVTLQNGETVRTTAGEIRTALQQIEDRNVVLNADPSGAIAGTATGQAAVDSFTGDTVPLNADPAGAQAGSIAAQSLINGVYGITRAIEADPSGAQRGSATAQGAINATHGVDRRVTVTADTSGATRAQSAMNAVESVTRFIRVITQFVQADGGLVPAISMPAGAEHVGAQKLAVGGKVAGTSPHPRADNIPIWATAGEVMMSNRAGDLYGRDRLLAMNSGRIDPRAFAAFMNAQGFARGGQIGPPPATQQTGGREVVQNFNFYYPQSERESTATRRAASSAALAAAY